MKTPVFLFGIILFAPSALQADSRTSANYGIVTESVDTKGLRSTSVNHTNDGGSGTATGISTTGSGDLMVKAGYAGQLYAATGFIVSATSTAVNEKSQVQLTGAQLLNDSTLLAVSGSAVTWSVVDGPISSIDASGLATSGTVYQTTPATAAGAYLGMTGTLALSVLNVDDDDYGTYTNDGLPDAWQVQYFGFDNPDAAPGVDADHTGQTNYFKYIAGLNPTNPASVFTRSILPVPGQSNQKALVFSPVVNGRTYTVEFSTDLKGWSPLTGATQNDNGNQRTVTDPDASGGTKFYRVLISKP